MAVNRYYSSTAESTTLSSGISNSATSMTVGSSSGWPVSYPHTAIIDRGTATEEVVTVTAAVGNTWTVTRGVDGTSAVSHSAGGTVVHGVSARDHREPQEHIAATSAAHGVSGSLVGTSDTQTLTNKTLTNPTINNGTWASAVLSGQPTITDFTNAGHNHNTAAGGGTIPQSSVTGLASALSTIDSTNTTQTTNISDLQSRMSAAESTVASHTSSISTNTTNISSNTSAISAIQNLAWTSYTPTLTASTTNPSLGTGSVREGAYVQLGKLVIVRANIKMGTGATSGTGTYRVSLPVTAKTLTTGSHFGTSETYDDSANDARDGLCRSWSSPGWDKVEFLTDGFLWTSTSPFGLAVDDTLGFTICYQAA